LSAEATAAAARTSASDPAGRDQEHADGRLMRALLAALEAQVGIEHVEVARRDLGRR
jgi:hypothetical protein